MPKKLAWHGHLAAWLIYAAGTGVSATWRLRFHDQSGCFDGTQEGPLLFSTWHNRLALSMAIYHRYVRLNRKTTGLAALISASRDGALLTKALGHFGVIAARGSSSRRGAQAILELTSLIEEGHHVAITPDGPRGPKYVVQEGIITLAQLTGTPIIPVGVSIHSKKSLRSWDQFQIPLPFSRCDVYLGKPITVPRNIDEIAREQFRAELERRMKESNAD